jgi:DNA polymerase III sliding clamp (beta) subunit (PCNA family)
MIEIQVAKQYLEKALSVVGPGLAKEDTLSGHFIFRVKDGEAEVLTQNGRVFGSCPIVCQCGEDGGFTVEAKRLKQWLRSVSDDALTLRAKDDGEVEVVAPEGELYFQSLDPAVFPYWDKLLKKIGKAQKKREAALEAGDDDPPKQVSFQIEAKRLASALTYIRNFVSDRETVVPHLCVAEMVKGHLMATNSATAAAIEIQGLEDSTLRIHRQDISATVGFLGLAGDEVIEVLESDRAVLFRRSDGSMFGVSRTTDAFPNLDLTQFEEVENWWELAPDEVKRAIQYIRSAADKEDTDLHFEDEDDNISLWMPAFHSKKKAKSWPIECVGRAKDDDGENVPVEPFRLNLEILTMVLASWEGKTARFDLYPPSDTRKGGFIRGQETRNGDVYSTILTFLR